MLRKSNKRLGYVDYINESNVRNAIDKALAERDANIDKFCTHLDKDIAELSKDVKEVKQEAQVCRLY